MHSYHDAIAWRRAKVLKRADQVKHWKEVFEKIKAHSQTRVLAREDLTGAYEYVEKLFPSCAPAVSETPIYKNDNTAFFPRIGLPSAGGMYIRPVGAVVICYAKKFSDDVVAVHELLHCVHSLLGAQGVSERQEEDFAYGKSIPYLVEQGYSEEWIVEEYMWPFYVGVTHACNPTMNREGVEKQCRLTCTKMVQLGHGGVDKEAKKKPPKDERWDLK